MDRTRLTKAVAIVAFAFVALAMLAPAALAQLPCPTCAVDDAVKDASKTVGDTTGEETGGGGGGGSGNPVDELVPTLGPAPGGLPDNPVGGIVDKIDPPTKPKKRHPSNPNTRPSRVGQSGRDYSHAGYAGGIYARALVVAEAGRLPRGAERLKDATTLGGVRVTTPLTLGEALQQLAETAQTLAFPLGLAFAVVAYLMVQGRIDSKDPKLALAAVDSEGDYLSFQ